MTAGDRGLHLVRTRRRAGRDGPEHPERLVDLGPVPAGPVLVLQGDQVAGGVHPGQPPGVLEQHQRQQAAGFAFPGHQLGQRPGQPDRLPAQVLPDQVLPGAGRVPLVEQQIQHSQHASGALRQQVRRRHLVRDARIADLVLGPDQPLGHGRLRDQERAGDLRGGQPGQCAQGQRHPGVQRERRMAAGEDQPQPVVGELAAAVTVVPTRGRPGGAATARAGQRRHLVQLGRLGAAAAQPVQGAVTGHRGQPGAGPARDPVPRPAPHRLGERVLGTVLGEIPVTGRPDQGGHHPSPLLVERRGDRGVDVGH